MVKIEAGCRIAVGDNRRKVTERVIAEGTVERISKQEGVEYIHLNTGFYLVVWPIPYPDVYEKET